MPHYHHWCGHCGQYVLMNYAGKMVEHVCIGCWFANDNQYRIWLKNKDK